MRRYYVIGGVALIRGRISGFQPAMIAAAGSANDAMHAVEWKGSVPCQNVNHVIRYGADAKKEVEVRLNRQRGEIEVATQISLPDARKLESEPAALRELCTEEINRVFSELASRYDFPALKIA